MKTQLTRVITALALCASLHQAAAQGTAFTYQGRLNAGGSPANGSYDLSFSLYTVGSGGSIAAGPATNSAVGVSNGLFTATLDFGSNVFNGTTYWLDISARTNGNGKFIELSPRQQLTPVPYALYAETSGSASTVIGGSSGWSLTGNDGSGDILGTTNSHPLYLVAGGFSAGTFWPFANGSVSVALGPDNYFSTSGNGGNFMAGGGYSGGPNFIYTDNSSIGGGYANRIDAYSPESVIAGGISQRIWSQSGASVISGGAYNTISNNATGGVIPGGQNNVVSGYYGFAAGIGAQALNQGAFVWADDSAGGAPFSSTANNQFSVRALGGVRFVTGGAGMTIDGVPVSGGGGGSNASYTISTVQTTNSGLDSSAMGYQNTASGNYATVAGGIGNTASGIASFIGGGGYDGFNSVGNTATFPAATVGGGVGNSALAYYATIAGGYSNTGSVSGAFVGGGFFNLANGAEAMVGGGNGNTAGNILRQWAVVTPIPPAG